MTPNQAATQDHVLPSLHPDTRLGAIRLVVGDLAKMEAFYEGAIGFEVLSSDDGLVTLGAGGSALVELLHDPSAPPRPYGTTGLFHLAVLVPDRPELARAIRRVVEYGWSFTGASDHLVSEAMYLDDPEGNGIEIYRDRPREEWRYASGELRMASLPLDVDAIVAELKGDEADWRITRRDTHLGHVHLQVSDLAGTERFYSEVLGFDVMVRSYPGALFVSAGGYHHHLGLNTWAGQGAPPPPEDARGLRWFEVVLPSADEYAAVHERLRKAGIEAREGDGALFIQDPSHNGLMLRTAEGS